MTYKLEVLKGKNAVLLTITEMFRVSTDVENVLKELIAIFNNATVPMYYISDVRNMKVNFSDVVMGLGKIALPGGASATPLLTHPNVKELIIILDSNSSIMKIGTKAIEQKQYGSHKVVVFPTVEEALEYVSGG